MNTSSLRELAESSSARHQLIERRDCGAQTDESECRGSRVHKHVYHCSKSPGHEGRHQDQIHCWSMERFDEVDVARYAPRDLSHCSCGKLPGCREGLLARAVLEYLAEDDCEGTAS